VTAPPRPALNTIEPFASLNARWSELTRREDELTAELRPLVAEIRKLGGYLERGGVPVRPAEGPSDYRPGLREKIADLVPFRRPEPAPLTDIDRLKAKAAEMSAELSDIIEAKKCLLPALNRARKQASAAVIDTVRGDYAVIAERMAAALIELGAAWHAHVEFLHELTAEGVLTSSLGQMVIGDLDDPLDTIGRALRWAAECRYIELSAVPPELLAR
jgi:hypothetical protein